MLALDGVRFVAACSVLFYHTQSILNVRHSQPGFGQFGVDMFFVLSGYVISLALARADSPWTFLVQRWTRVFPMYFVLTTLLLAISKFKPGLLDHTRFSIENYLKSIFFIPYFKETGAIHPMLGIGWSLNYEMLFYLMCALTIVVRPRIQAKAIQILALMIFAIVTLGAILPAQLPGHGFLGNTIVFEFLAGALLHEFGGTLDRRLPLSAPYALALATLAWLSMAVIELSSMPDFSPMGTRFIWFTPFACIFLHCARQAEPAFSKIRIGRTVTAHLGAASYATYLTHLYVVQAAKRLAPWTIQDSIAGSAVAIVGVMAIALGVGSLSYLCADRPMVAGLRRQTRKFA